VLTEKKHGSGQRSSQEISRPSLDDDYAEGKPEVVVLWVSLFRDANRRSADNSGCTDVRLHGQMETIGDRQSASGQWDYCQSG